MGIIIMGIIKSLGNDGNRYDKIIRKKLNTKIMFL